MGNNLIRNGFRIHSKEVAILVSVLSLFFLIYGFGGGIVLAAAPQQLTNVSGGECAACHGTDSKVPHGHVDTKDMDLKQCLCCHGKDKPKLTNTLPLAHSHLLSGVSCEGCHKETSPPEFVGTDQCLSCHKPEALVAATKDVKDANPHNSHYGPELDCDVCHHTHETSENFCNQCHERKFVIPSPIAKPGKRVEGNFSKNPGISRKK